MEERAEECRAEATPVLLKPGPCQEGRGRVRHVEVAWWRRGRAAQARGALGPSAPDAELQRRRRRAGDTYVRWHSSARPVTSTEVGSSGLR